MGINQDHFIWISSDESTIYEFHAKAVQIFQKHEMANLVSPVIPSMANGYASFFIAPDGSKEGWRTSDQGDEARDELITALSEDSAPWCDWMEVTTGEITTGIKRGSMIHDDEDDDE